MTVSLLNTMTAPPCMLHGRHAPVPVLLEQHHIVPEGWWGELVSESRNDIAIVCPTGHRSVHYYIERLMRGYAELVGEGEPPRVLRGELIGKAVKSLLREGKCNRNEVRMAREALLRFTAAGGSLKMLCDNDEWGGD
jgi:hypothetical protein